jgi:hypothetical protein
MASISLPGIICWGNPYHGCQAPSDCLCTTEEV